MSTYIMFYGPNGGLNCSFTANRYQKTKVIGEGFHGTVYQGVDKKTNEIVAIKVINLTRARLEQAKQEVMNHQILNHENVIKLREAFKRGDNYIYLIMDYADRGNLHQFLMDRSSCGGRLPEPMARFFYNQLISAVDYCHDKGVVSRDIKLANILLSSSKGDQPFLTVKLCDFGFSSKYETSSTSAMVGTPDYLAPEVIQCEGLKNYEGQKVDVWSCGVVLYNLVTGYQPFSGVKIGENHKKVRYHELIMRIVNADYSFPPEVTLSSECINLINRCLKVNPKERITIADILKHPWFTQNTTPAT